MTATLDRFAVALGPSTERRAAKGVRKDALLPTGNGPRLQLGDDRELLDLPILIGSQEGVVVLE
jgi:hypothetical protein